MPLLLMSKEAGHSDSQQLPSKGKSHVPSIRKRQELALRDVVYLLEMVEYLTFIRRGPVYFFRPVRKILSTFSRNASLESVEENQNVSKASAITPSASGLQTNKTQSGYLQSIPSFLSLYLSFSSDGNVTKD